MVWQFIEIIIGRIDHEMIIDNKLVYHYMEWSTTNVSVQHHTPIHIMGYVSTLNY